jgi:hypothetical protein
MTTHRRLIMAEINAVCREVIEKAEWAAIATAGPDGPHVVGTWGDYIRTLGFSDDGVFLVPVGGMARLESNLASDARVELMWGTRAVTGATGSGKGCLVRGRGEIQTTGDHMDTTRASFPWARGVLVVTADEVAELL